MDISTSLFVCTHLVDMILSCFCQGWHNLSQFYHIFVTLTLFWYDFACTVDIFLSHFCIDVDMTVTCKVDMILSHFCHAIITLHCIAWFCVILQGWHNLSCFCNVDCDCDCDIILVWFCVVDAYKIEKMVAPWAHFGVCRAKLGSIFSQFRTKSWQGSR